MTADGHPVVSAGLKHFFDGDTEIKIVKQVNEPDAIPEFLGKQKADMVLMDTEINGKDTLLLVRYMQKHFPEVQVLLFSSDKQAATIRRANYAGVAGYLYKNASMQTLKQAIIDVAAGKKVRDKAIDLGALTVPKVSSKLQKVKGSTRIFSPRETQVLKYLAEGLTNYEISQQLGVTQSTVETFRARIMAKSKRKNVAELIKWAMEMGLLK